MMTQNNDVLYMSEYIKNVLYFAITRPGKVFKNTTETSFLCVDDELVYENYFSDFGPLNLGCVYKYCKILNEKIDKCLNNQIVVHYTSCDPKKSTNAAFLMGCFGVLYLSLPPREALKPLLIQGYNYRPFQDATPGESSYTISLLDCLQAMDKARQLGFYDFRDFNYEDYVALDKIEGGDLNWIVPGKFLAFIGPVDTRAPIYHRPEEYISYFKENNVKIVIRLNKKMYDGNVFMNVGIHHYDLFFVDGSCPPRNICFKFLRISENCDGAIAVHCKAGLGRTGSLIGCYLIKHYRMTSHEAIGWMRICRPGSVIGQQQEWLEKLEPWLIKQGNLYRKREFGDCDKIPEHKYGLYSLAEKALRCRPVLFRKSPSPPPPTQRQTRVDGSSQSRPQASKIRRTTNVEMHEHENEERFLASCDLTVTANVPVPHMKGYIIKNSTVFENNDELDRQSGNLNMPIWRRILVFCSCPKVCDGMLWKLSVRCVKIAPDLCDGRNVFCTILDKVITIAPIEKEQYIWGVKSPNMNYYQGNVQTEDQSECKSRRSSGSGDPRSIRWPSQDYTVTPLSKRNASYSQDYKKINSGFLTIPTFCTTQGPIVKTINEAKDFLMRSSICRDNDRLFSSVQRTPNASYKKQNEAHEYVGFGTARRNVAASYTSTVPRDSTQPHYRRRLGRSPSPVPRIKLEQTRATNTVPLSERADKRNSSKTAIRDALSRLKLTVPRYGSTGAGSVGAASLGARRVAPSGKRAPSVRSDERPTATQGDVLNSIKYQRRLLDKVISEKVNALSRDNQDSSHIKTKTNGKKDVSGYSIETRSSSNKSGGLKDKSVRTGSSRIYNRPGSPTVRHNVQTSFY